MGLFDQYLTDTPDSAKKKEPARQSIGSGIFEDALNKPLPPSASVGGVARTIAGSAVDTVGHGIGAIGELGQGIADRVGSNQPGVTAPVWDAFKGIGEGTRNLSEKYIKSGMSEGDKAATQDTFKGDVLSPSTWKLPETGAGLAHGIAQGVGSLGPTVAAALLTGGGSALAPVMAGVSGLTTAGGAADEVRQNLAGQTPEQWAATPAYQVLVAQGMTPDQAKKRVTDDAAFASAGISGAAGMVGGAVEGKVIGDLIVGKGVSKVLGKAAPGVAGRTAIGGTAGAGGEAFQEWSEKTGQNVGENIGRGDAAFNNFDRDTFGDAVLGGLVGGGVGIAGGVAAKPAGALSKTVEAGKSSGAVAALPHLPNETMVVFPDGTTGTRKQMDEYLAKLPEDQRAAAMAQMLYGQNAPAAEAVPEPLGLPNLPAEKLIVFPDGSTGTRQQVDEYLAGLSADQRPAAMAKLLYGDGTAPSRIDDTKALADEWDRFINDEANHQAGRVRDQATKNQANEKARGILSQVADEETQGAADTAPAVLPSTAVNRGDKPAEVPNAPVAADHVPDATKMVGNTADVITLSGGRPYTSQNAAKQGAKKHGVTETHDVTPSDDGKGFVLRRKAITQEASNAPVQLVAAQAVAQAVPPDVLATGKPTEEPAAAPARTTDSGVPGARPAVADAVAPSVVDRQTEDGRTVRVLQSEVDSPRALLRVHDAAGKPKLNQDGNAELIQREKLIAPKAAKPVSQPKTEAKAEAAPAKATALKETAPELSKPTAVVKDSLTTAEDQKAANRAKLAETKKRRAETKAGDEQVATAAADAKPSEVDTAAHEAAASPQNDKPEPTDGQKQAGNYAKGHVIVAGLDISIENPAGSQRSGTDPNGKAWSVEMQSHYGYFKRTEGKDGDQVDVFIKPGTPADYAGPVFVVDQIKPGNGHLDEHKVMLGWDTLEAARAGYLENYAPGWRGIGNISQATLDEFRAWLADGDTAQPFWMRNADQPPALQKSAGNATPGQSGNATEKASATEKELGEKIPPSDSDVEIAKPASKIGDFGEKLEGARKDLEAAMRREYSDDELASLPLSKIWPASEVDAIADPFVAAVAHAARAEVPAKPRVPYKVKQWVMKVKTVRGLALRVLDGAVTRERFESVMKDMRSLEGFRLKVQLLEAIDRDQWKRIGAIHDHSQAYRYGDDGKTRIPAPSMLVEIDGRLQHFDGAKSIDEAVDAVNEKLGVTATAKKMQFEIRGSDSVGYFINKKGDPEYRRLKTFKTSKEAFEYRGSNYDDLVAAWDGVKERDNVKESDVRGTDNRPRTAQDWRQGKDISAEEFQQQFGFRGGQFGNWVKQGSNAKDRQWMLNSAYDALMDLADIVDVPPKAVSLNGELGIAFGARGSGAASAHYESDTLVINLTKTRGAGTLAHEWFHALDNYFQRRRGEISGDRENRYITYAPETYYQNDRGVRIPAERFDEAAKYGFGPGQESPPPRLYSLRRQIGNPSDWKKVDGVRPEVGEKFAALVKALNESPMKRRAALIDKGKGGGYWSRIIELAARAFENYTIAKMAERGYHNDYLANVLDPAEFKRDMGRYPYLLPEELAPVSESFDALFGVMETQESDDGRVGLQAVRDNGDASPEEAQKVQAGIEGKSLIDAARFIMQNAEPAKAEVAKKAIARLVQMQMAGVKLELKVAHRGESVPVGLINARGYTTVDFDGQGWDIAVWINGADVSGKVGTDYETVLHEIVHAATTATIKYASVAPNSYARKLVVDLHHVANTFETHINQRFSDAATGKIELTEFEKDIQASANNAFATIDELVAWALSSREAQAYLETIPYKKTGQSLWSRFVQAVRSLLGLPATADTALSEVLRVSEEIMGSEENVFGIGFPSVGNKRGVKMATQQGYGSIVHIHVRNVRSDESPADDTDLASRNDDESRGKVGTGQSAAAVRAEVAAKIGKARLAILERKGLFKIHETAATLPERGQRYPDAKGWFDGKTSHLVADRMAPGEAVGIFHHEAWHMMLRSLRLAESPQFAKIMDRLKKINDNGAAKDWFYRAADKIPEEDLRSDARRYNELAAYAIEEYVNKQQAQPLTIRLFVRDLIAAVRAFLMDSFGWVPEHLTLNDLAAITKRYVRSMGRSQPTSWEIAAPGIPASEYSRQSNDPKAAAFEDPGELANREHDQRADEHKLTAAQREAFRPQKPADKVTGFFRAEEHEPTILRAKAYAEANGIQAFYIEADVSNLGGINDHFNNNHSEANKIFRAMTDIFREELERAGAKSVAIRHGGDEISAVLMDSSEAAIQTAATRIKDRIRAYANEQGLSQIKNPKGKKPGIGLYLGHSLINGNQMGTIIRDATALINDQKNAFQEQQNVGRTQGKIPEGIRSGQDAGRTGPGDTGASAALPRVDSDRGRNDHDEDHFSRGAAAGITDKLKDRFTRTTAETSGESGREYSDQQRQMFERVGRTVEKPSLESRIKAIWKDAGKKIAQGMVDQFRPLRELGGQAYLLARLSKGTEGAIDAFLHHGKLKLTDNVYDADTSGGAIDQVFKPLQGEGDDFLWWVASNRAARLSAEDRENLFTKEDIAAGRSLAAGETAFEYTLADGTKTKDRNAIYRDALKKFDGFNKNALDIAEQSGLIDGESRKYWEHEFYVPFYRVNDEEGGFSGAHVKKGLVRQEAFKQLKGGQNKLNADLLENTLQNWAHLIDASAKNRAAKATLTEARKMGIARPARQGEKDAVWYMGAVTRAIPKGVTYQDGGVEKVSDGTATIREHGKVSMLIEGEDAPYIMEAITSLQYAGLGSWAKPLTAVKHWMTIGVTASPAFKIRNLIRDSVQAIGTADLSYNPARNLKEGFKATRRDTQNYVSMLASGALIRFGTMEADHAKKIRRLVDKGVDDSTILDSPNKLKAFYGKYLEPGVDAYNEIGNRGEEINRAALYNQLTAKGMGHAEAALMARDLMDFSMQGTWAPIRFLTQVVPFMNARMQGLYKLGRASAQDKRRFATVVGAVALFSTLLMLAYEDDDDWKKREDWDRDTNWWFKIGGVAFRVPKPFEIGTLGTLAERGVELFVSDEMTGKRFRERVFHMLSDTLAMNPIPQLFKPIIDLYANKNSFTGRPIETMGMERLLPEYRFTSRTTLAARAVSTAGNTVTGNHFLSPVQVDHLVQGYFAWLGSFTTGTVDRFTRPLTDDPKQPTEDYWKTATAGFLSSLPAQQSRYVSQMYEQARVLEQAHGTYQSLLKSGRREEAITFRQENAAALAKYKTVENVKKIESQINQRIRKIENSDLPANQKRHLIDIANRQKDAAARRVPAA